MALAAGLFMAAPVASAAASEPEPDASLARMVERVDGQRDELSALAQDLIRQALGRSVQRATEAGRAVEAMMTWGVGLHALTRVEPSAFEPAADEDSASERVSTRRFDFEISNDPLAGV